MKFLYRLGASVGLIIVAPLAIVVCGVLVGCTVAWESAKEFADDFVDIWKAP